MALGGGTFIAQNKVLPGAYINFVSAASASATLSDRGIAAIGVVTGWGKTGEVFEVTSGDFQKNSLKIFGMAYTDDGLKPLRELFANARTVYCYRLNGGGVKAANDYAAAKYAGTKGNDIKIIIRANVDDSNKFDVITVFGTNEVDTQTVDAYVKTADTALVTDKTYYTKSGTAYTAVDAPDVSDIGNYYEAATAAQLSANDYVDFKADVVLAVTAGIPLTGGTDGTVDSAAHQAFLDALEPYSFNALGCASDDNVIKGLYVSYCKRLRDEIGKKFQLVVHGKAADYEGVINVKNTITDDNKTGYELVYWVTGIAAGTAVNKTATNKMYDGEYSVDAAYTQSQLEQAITNGEFAFHKVGNDIRVLKDINALVTTSDTKGKIFKSNQTIRVIDQIANDIAVIFNTNYLGNVPNDDAGRVALWMDIVKHHSELARIRAIQDFSEDDVAVEPGDDNNSVVVSDAINVIGAMEKLYMTVTVS